VDIIPEDLLPLTAPPEEIPAVILPAEPPVTETPPEERPITLVTDEVPPEVFPVTVPAVQPVETVPANTRDTKLYFIEIDTSGQVVRRAVVRKNSVSDTPLMDALRAVFTGPNGDESGKGLMSLIPPGTRLISASVKGGVATINVSEEFRFNQYGAEGLIGQLMQVVYTATEFSTVTSVQILIEGQRKEYLSGDGIWIGTPLSRESF
jgi:spore germination protein GerM